MNLFRRNLRSLLSVIMFLGCLANVFASALPLLTTDAKDPILYRIKNTRRTVLGKANYWVMPNGLSTNQEDAVEVYFTGVQTSDYMRAKIHVKGGSETLTADYTWGDGIDWYIKEFKSAQGGDYSGVLISNASTFPDVTNDKPADDGKGCWYVGSSNTAPWLYGGQWDGSIFTFEIVDPSRENGSLIEIPQSQGEDISDGASRATMVKGDDYTTYTTKTDICVIVKMYNVDVTDCDYIVVKFAEPLPTGIKAAFWKQGGTDNVDIEAGVTEYKYVFADDSKCAISNGILPQLTLLTIYAGTAKTVKIIGIYKHSTKNVSSEPDPLADAIELLSRTIDNARPYVVGTKIGQYTGTDVASIIAEAEDYIVDGDCTVDKVQEFTDRINKAIKTLYINLPAAGTEMRLYNPSLKSYVSAPAGATRMKMVAQPDETCVFVFDGKNLIGKSSGLYVTTYELNAQECPDEVIFVEAYGSNPGLYTVEFMGGTKERCIQAEEAGKECNRHYLISQSGYSSATTGATAFELQLLSGDVICPENVTQKYIVNYSFEEGLKGWVYSAIRGDVDSKPNSNGTYKCTGTDGDYLFNTWVSSDSRVGATQDECAYQTIYGLLEGEYRLEVLAASNQSTKMDLFANSFVRKFVPREKSALTEHRLTNIFVTPETKSLVVGVRSASWFKCDRFILTYMGKTKGYENYLANGMADASIMNPIILDCFDGQQTDGFTYTPAEGSAGTYPSADGGVQSDGTQVDMSKMQLWTSAASTLGNATLSTSYDGLRDGWYRVETAVRVLDEVGTMTKPIKGLTLYAGESQAPITKGSTPTAGDKKAKSIYGEYGVVAKVTDGKLEAGFKLEDCSINWLGWQNFRLEYLGTEDPTEEVINLNLPADQFVALCLPYDITPEYFGPFYRLLNVDAQGKALVTPYSATSISAGTPVVVKATGKNPELSINQISISSNSAGQKLSSWNNTLMKGTYDGFTWVADLVNRTQIEGNKLEYEEADLTNLDFEATMENRAAQRFWSENPNYTTDSQSTISNYLSEPTYNRRDQPNPIVIPVVPAKKTQRLFYSTDSTFAQKTLVNLDANVDKAEIYNLIPGLTYYYYILNTEYKGKFVANGPLRMLYVGPNVYNVRDLGGKQVVDGRYVRYGKIYRSGELNGGYKATSDELSIMKKAGVGAEIDLRGEIDNDGAGTSAYGFRKGQTYYYVGGDHYIADEATKLANGDEEAKGFWKEEIEFTVQNLAAGKGINFHCRIGADRTGCLGLLLEGLLGVKESDLIRDYETTSFSTAAGTRIKHNTFDTGLKFIKNMIPTGGTLRDGFDKYVTGTLGVDKALIEQYRDLMLLDEPEATAIEQIQDVIEVPTAKSGVYDLNGRKLNSLQRGLNVIDGRIVMVK